MLVFASWPLHSLSPQLACAPTLLLPATLPLPGSPWGAGLGLLTSGQACQPLPPSIVSPPSPRALCVFSLYPCHLECMYFFFFLLDQKVSLGTAAPVCGICGDIPLVLEGLLSQGKHSLSLPCDEYRNEWRKERSFLHLKVLLESKRK